DQANVHLRQHGTSQAISFTTHYFPLHAEDGDLSIPCSVYFQHNPSLTHAVHRSLRFACDLRHRRRRRSRRPSSFCRLTARCRGSFGSRLLDEFSHRRNMPRRTLLRPLFEPPGRGFQVLEKVRIRKFLAKLRDHSLKRFPDTKKLAAGFEEKILVQQPIVQQRAGLLPVAKYHAHRGAIVSSRRRNAEGIFNRLRDEILLKPVARLAEPGLATQV